MGSSELLMNLDKIHTTDLGITRVRENLYLDAYTDIVEFCKSKIKSKNVFIKRNGKNQYVCVDDIVIVVNAYTYTIITAHWK